MDFQWLLFGFEGRINREKCWLGGLFVNFSGVILALILLTIARLFGSGAMSLGFDVSDLLRLVDPTAIRSAIDSFHKADVVSMTTLLPVVFRAAVTPVVAWCLAAIIIKRLHDRDKSGWWIVPFVVAPALFTHFSDRLGDSTAVEVLDFGFTCLGAWGVIELLFLRGTRKVNRFGPDPLAADHADQPA